MKRQIKATLTEGPVGKTLFKLSLPMVIGIMAIVTFNIVDTFFVAQLGAEQLAAFSFTFPIVMIISYIGMGIGNGTSSVISNIIGKGDDEYVREITSAILLFSFGLALILTIAGLLTIQPLFTLLGASPQMLAYITEYMEIWYIGMSFLIVPMVGNAAIRASGDTKFPSYVMLVAAIVNVILDPILIFGLLGFPRMELQGAALATVIAYMLTFAAGLFVLYAKKHMLTFKLSMLCFVVGVRKVLHIGIPSTASSLMMPLSQAILIAMIAGLGEYAVAAYGVAIRIESLAIVVFMALSSTMNPFIGQNYGARSYERVDDALRIAYKFCIYWGACAALALYLIAPVLAPLFADESEVVAAIVLYLSIVPIAYGLLGVALVSGATYNGLGLPFASMLISASRLILLLVPLAYIGREMAGLQGIFYAMLGVNLVVGALAWLSTKKMRNGLLTIDS